MGKTLVCGKCAERYVLGVDAMSLTSEEMAGMMGGMIGSMPDFLRVAHPKGTANSAALAGDEATIMRLGPARGWECDKCQHVNRW